MDAQIENQETTPVSEPIGDVTLGKVNPRTLTQEEFRKSPDLLFHGGEKEFTFSQEFDYSQNYSSRSDSFVLQHTLGQGFYATPDRRDAELFSTSGHRHAEKPAVIEVMSYQANMLDLRAKAEPSKNAPVPRSLFDEYLKFWKEKFTKEYENYNHKENQKYLASVPRYEEEDAKLVAERKQNPSTLEHYFPTRRIIPNPERDERDRQYYSYTFEKEYLDYLERLSSKRVIELRAMLNTTGGFESNIAASVFPQFILNKGYDGLIYNEGGDDPQHKNPASYVFYNLNKIGTFETWHNPNTPKSTPKEKIV